MHTKMFFLVLGIFYGFASLTMTKDNVEISQNFNNFNDGAFPLIEQGTDPNYKDENGDTAMHRFARYSLNLELLIDLFCNGADLGAVNNNNETPLMLAIEKENWHLIGWLFELERWAGEQDLNIDVQDAEKRTALHKAAGKNPFIVRDLLMRGANQNMRDHNGKTPREIALLNERRDIVTIFDQFKRPLGNIR